jgi:hypothetical protein
MFATFPTCFLLKWRRWLVRILNIGPRGAERATYQATIGNDLQMCRYTRSRARLAPVPFPGILWSAMVFPAVIQLVTSSSPPRSTKSHALGYRRCASGIVPFSGPSSWCTLGRTRWCRPRTQVPIIKVSS